MHCESCYKTIGDEDPFRLTSDDVVLCPKCFDECFADEKNE